ncbi:MAG TPA: glycoside hydrolase family 140 protein [Acidobacteriota bacterium]|nr:glycoside hydrolase family 140 protein [Acidobacteriota bacterium]
MTCSRIFFWLVLTLVTLSESAALQAATLGVSESGRYLTYADGTPFFYLGDTAWELFHRLDRKEADLYLTDRVAKGFTVIQAVALAELDGLNTPNVYGHRPLIENDPTRPDVRPGNQDDYWDHVDYVVNKAEELGLFIGMLPTWGDKWVKRWGEGPVIFTPDNAEVFGEWLGRRYENKPIIWILGGDRSPDNETYLEIIRAMARGLERGDKGMHLMTFHPQGGQNSAQWFHQDDWLDFNMIQSGHARPGKPNYQFMLENRELLPTKPTLDGEPCYEDHPVKGEVWNRRNEPGVLLAWFDEWDVRRAAYMSMLAGACGHTYGDHSMWQMWIPEREPLSVARTPWFEALSDPGSRQMKFFRDLLEARPFYRLVPDQELVADQNKEDTGHVRAARDSEGKFAIFYIPTGRSVTVRLDRLPAVTLRAFWFNPRQNAAQLIGTFKRTERSEFEPPTQGRNNDWILVIDDADQDLPRIGFSYQHIVPKTID